MTGGLTLFLCKTFTSLVPYGCLIWNAVLNYLLSCVEVSLGAMQAVLACCCSLWSWCALFTTVEFLKRAVAGCAAVVVFRNVSVILAGNFGNFFPIFVLQNHWKQSSLKPHGFFSFRLCTKHFNRRYCSWDMNGCFNVSTEELYIFIE